MADGLKLEPAHISLLHEAKTDGYCKASTEYERGLIAQLVVYGYLDSSNRITRLGRGALKGQGGQS